MNELAHSPHAHAPVTLGKVMGTVMLALIPATSYGFWLYGWPAVNLWVLALLSALIGEAFVLRLQQRAIRPALLDGSGVLTAWLLVLSLPPTAPWWIAVLGSLFAVIVGKQIFGGLGQNVFNPAMAARVMLLISFPLEMTSWVTPSGSAVFAAGRAEGNFFWRADGWYGQRLAAGSREDGVSARYRSGSVTGGILRAAQCAVGAPGGQSR